jgi:hypothetical protein
MVDGLSGTTVLCCDCDECCAVPEYDNVFVVVGSECSGGSAGLAV